MERAHITLGEKQKMVELKKMQKRKAWGEIKKEN